MDDTAPAAASSELGQARSYLDSGDYRAVLAVTYPTLVRVQQAPAAGTSEDWQVVALYALATALRGDPGRAVDFAEAAYDALQSMCGRFDEATLTAQRALAVAQQAAGDYTAAVNTVEAVHAAGRRAHGEHAVLTLLAAADLATALHGTGRCDDATQLLYSTMDTYVTCYGQDPTSIRMLARLAAMVRDCGQFDHAHDLFGQARRLATTHGDAPLAAMVTALARAGTNPAHPCRAARAPAPPTGNGPQAGSPDGEWLAAIRDGDIYQPDSPSQQGHSRRAYRSPHSGGGAATGHPPGHPLTTLPHLPAHANDHADGVALRRVADAVLGMIPRPRPDDRPDLIAAVRRPVAGLRQVTVVNPKGGAGKTIATLMLALTFGQARGGFVLAWDNNETQGTLGMRAQYGEHGRTVRDLLGDLHRFTDGAGRIGDLERYLRGQDEAMFDVLASDEAATAGAMLTAAAFRAIRDVVARFYKLLIVDTGNNVRAENWQAALDATDQLVITVSARSDSAETAARLLDHLDRTGRGAHVQRAVAVVTMPPRTVRADIAPVEEHFRRRCRAVLRVPHDRHLDAGAPIDYPAVSPASRGAWLRVAAAVADGL